MRPHTIRSFFTFKRTRWLVSAMAIVALVAGGIVPAFANLTGSTFESNDGNMIVDTKGNEDWANAPNLTTATDFPSGAKTDNSFTTGSKEDDLNPVIGIAAVPPNKNDLIHFYTANETVTVGGTPTSFLYLAFTRAVTSGNADIDFEVNHAYLGTTPPTTPTQTGTCPSGTTDEFGVCVPLQRTDGDALFQFIFPGGGGPITSLQIWRWASSTSSPFFVPLKGVTNSAGCLSTSSGPPCWSDPSSPSASQFDGASNSTAITNPLDPTCSGNCLDIATFGEAAINLNATGIFPRGTCTHFGGAWAKSRSSDSGSSALQDVIVPVPTNINNCGEVRIIKHTDPRGLNQSFSYTSNLVTAPPSGQSTCASPTSFSLNDNGNTTGDSQANTEDCQFVPAGSYTVLEGAEPANFVLESLTCTATGTGSSGSQDGTTPSQADITVAPGGLVTCTYTNKQQLGAINITKTSSKAAATRLAGAQFTITSPGGFNVTKTTDSNGTICVDHLPFGTYSVQETAPPSGYNIDHGAAVSVPVDHNASCTSGTPNAPPTFTDTPLTDITVTATSEATGGTQSTITCVNSLGTPIPGSPQGPAGSVTLTSNGLAPDIYTCTVKVDP